MPPFNGVTRPRANTAQTEASGQRRDRADRVDGVSEGITAHPADTIAAGDDRHRVCDHHRLAGRRLLRGRFGGVPRAGRHRWDGRDRLGRRMVMRSQSPGSSSSGSCLGSGYSGEGCQSGGCSADRAHDGVLTWCLQPVLGLFDERDQLLAELRVLRHGSASGPAVIRSFV
jgi:hypothetical protein